MKKYLPITIAAFFFIWPVIIIKLLSPYFDNITMNSYRAAAASAALLLTSFFACRQELFRGFRQVGRFVVPTLLLFLFQIIWVAGITRLTPTVAILIHRSQVLFVAVLSFLLFRDERRVIKSPVFLLGGMMSALGVFGVIAGRGGLQWKDFSPGTLLMLAGALCWSLYLLAVKKLVRKVPPLAAVTVTYTLSVPLFLIVFLLRGNPSSIARAPAWINLLLFASGILCMGAANALNYLSIRLIGTTLSSFFVLLTPFFTGVASFFIFREILTPVQIAAGVLLLSGCLVLTRAKTISEPEGENPS